jgi:hypothetical protein
MNTHRLVSIAEMEQIDRQYEGIEARLNAKSALLLNSPKIDLSEEGIKEKSITFAKSQNVELFEKIYCKTGYQQAIKDLLNPTS